MIEPAAFWVTLGGVSLGLGTALSQSFSYVFSRRFLARFDRRSVLLLALAHVMMGLLSAVLLPVFHDSRCPALAVYVWPALGAAGFYLAAQISLFQALKRVDASRVSPLLGLKVLVLAVIASSFLGQSLSPGRWMAVALCVMAAFLLNEIGGRMPPRAVLWVLATVVGYCLSDLSIARLVGALKPMGVRAPFFGACVAYVVCGVVGLAVLWAQGRPPPGAWKAAMPHALAWLASMWFFYGAIVCIGVVFAVIVQSTRGILSIGMGVVIAARGLHHIEQRTAPGVAWKRLTAAVLMTAAIAFYWLS